MPGDRSRTIRPHAPLAAPRWRRARATGALRRVGVALAGGVALVASLAAAAPASASPTSFLSHFSTVSNVASTIPANGDLNPYGIANVPFSTGALVRGDTLVSNFNAGSNRQGTGTTVVEISPGGQVTEFAALDAATLPGACPGGVGLTTALVVLNDGYMVVGSLPVTNAGTGTPEAGCLIVLNSQGVPVETWSGRGINGPWDMTDVQFGGFADLFVTNVLNGLSGAAQDSPVSQGTVQRLSVVMPPGRAPVLIGSSTIGTGFAEELDPSALVIGPTGVALGPNGTLYVADTVNSRIAAIPFAVFRSFPATGGGITLTGGNQLSGPLGLTLAPNGDLVTVNGGNGNGVEVTPWGFQFPGVQFDPANSGGDLFGLTIAPGGHGVLFVDDGDNTLKLLH
jgi:NHL repeat-containing protein